MTESEAERSVRRYWEQVWTEGDVAAVADFYAPTFRLNGRETSAADFAAGAARWRGHFSGFTAQVEELLVCGDAVVSRVVYRARHTGDFATVPATGASIELSGIDIFEFEDGRVVRHWHETDHLDLFQQLGAEVRPRDSDL